MKTVMRECALVVLALAAACRGDAVDKPRTKPVGVVAVDTQPQTAPRTPPDGLLARPGAARLHAAITRRSVATLLAMLRLEQPNNHDFAHDTLKAISGRSRAGAHDGGEGAFARLTCRDCV